jgi:endonuclease/exonuclease/phosphatase family metal-dependent hydrolase
MPQALIASAEVREAAWTSLETRFNWSSRSLVAGDFNAASTSHYHKRFRTSVPLRDSREGFGRQVSWPSKWWTAPFRIAIDHALIGADIRVIKREIVPIPGSDHSAVRLELGIKVP